MNKPIFIDTGAFIALANQSDQYHATACTCLEVLLSQRTKLITSNFVLDEAYTRIRSKAGYNKAILFGENIQKNREIKIITIDKSTETKAWEIFKKYKDQSFSYTDCTSFALIKLKKLKAAFAFDHDFRIFGIELIPT